MGTENNVKLLWDCANTLNVEGHTHQLLKSYYMTQCRKLARKNLQMPKDKFANVKMCPRCSSSWNAVEFRMKLCPQQIAHSSKAKKLIAKLEESKTSSEKRSVLSRKQRKRAKWLRKRVLSNVEIECELCHHKTRLPLEKPENKKHDEAASSQLPTQEDAPTPVPLKPKKKKHKNKTAGLNITKSKSSPPAAPTKTREPLKKSQNKPISDTNSTGKQTRKSNLNLKINTSKPTTIISEKLSQKFKAKKSKKKSKVIAPSVTPKVQSKTQQKNSLLQLAALLKAQTVKPRTNTAQTRLEALLK